MNLQWSELPLCLLSPEQQIQVRNQAEICRYIVGNVIWSTDSPPNRRCCTYVDLAKPGDLLEPLEIQELWYLVRVEKFLSAALDEQLGQELQDELFEKWLDDKIQAMNVKLEVKF